LRGYNYGALAIRLIKLYCRCVSMAGYED